MDQGPVLVAGGGIGGLSVALTLHQIVEHLRGRATSGLSTEQIMRMTRG